jgi:hypothetical protein
MLVTSCSSPLESVYEAVGLTEGISSSAAAINGKKVQKDSQIICFMFILMWFNVQIYG